MSEELKTGRELEQQLCVICNGKGIKEGENPMCPEHYMSEVVQKKNDKDNPMAIVIGFEEDSGFFFIKFMEGKEAIFNVRMNPGSFEKFSNDLIKTAKNYNLWQAKQYKERQANEQKEAEEAQQSVSDKISPIDGDQAQPQQS